MIQEMVVSISDLVLRIKNILNQTIDLSGIWIQGEISNLTKHRSGHYYFSLKDKTGELNCIMFSSYVSHLDFDVQEGSNVLVMGTVNVYEQRGQLQLVVRQMKQDGIGELYLEFEKRKKELSLAGYFNEDHKKLKPDYIENIGVITAKEGAALQDVLTTIKKKWPMMKVTLYPAYVQGKLASKSIIKALKYADQIGHDALLIVRGGGSFEDLFCFNDVELIQTIYNLNTYTVSGVGHDTDTTLCDLVSDYRCVTPTAAASWVCLDQYEVLNKIKENRNSMVRQLSHLMDINRNQYIQLCRNPYLKDPKNWIIDKNLRLDSYFHQLEKYKNEYVNKIDGIHLIENKLMNEMRMLLESNRSESNKKVQNLSTSMNTYYQNQTHKFYNYCDLLDAFSPLKILKRGYSVTSKENHIIHSIHDINVDEEITTRLQDGVVKSKILTIKEKAHGE